MTRPSPSDGFYTSIFLPYGDQSLDVQVPSHRLAAALSPLPVLPAPDPIAEIRRALREPIDAPPLGEASRGAKRVVILADDMTRQTPADLILPEVLDELNRAGISDEQVTVLIALGTHRAMSPSEIETRFGPLVMERVPVVNNPWQDPSQMVNLGLTTNGTPIQVSRLALKADFLLGLGCIVPHHIPGYSGGSKIVQPGICGPGTTGATHFLSTRTSRSYLGEVENVVRAEMDQIAARVGLKAIFNTVLNRDGRLVRAFYGHPIHAHRAGVHASRAVYGVPFERRTDIVVAGTHPADIEFWQAHKALYAADRVVADGGVIIVVTPCPEGVSVMHPRLLDYAHLEAGEIETLVSRGEVEMVAGALALAWAKVRRRARIFLVSAGITPDETRALGFTPYGSLELALSDAMACAGRDAQITFLTHAPETLPILSEPA